jgi:hypothetical protein
MGGAAGESLSLFYCMMPKPGKHYLPSTIDAHNTVIAGAAAVGNPVLRAMFQPADR